MVPISVMTRPIRVRQLRQWVSLRRILTSLLGAATAAYALRAASGLLNLMQVWLFTNPAKLSLKSQLIEAGGAFLAVFIPMIVLFLLTTSVLFAYDFYHKMTFLGVLLLSVAFLYWFLAAILLVLWHKLGPIANLPLVLPPVIGFLGFSLLRSASRVIARARQYMLRNAEEVMSGEARPPLLYLRPFEADTELEPPGYELPSRESEMWTITSLRFWTERRDLTFEEVLCRGLSEVSPVIAIGKPGEKLPMLGAARKYVPDDQWRDEVIRLVDACSIVCVLAGYTSGIVWELLHVAATCPLEKILLFLPPRFDECAWSRFLQSIGTQAPGLPLPRSLEPGTLALAFRPEAVVIGFSGKPISANYGEIARSTLQRLQERQAGP
jgi:hypothetical protein